MDGGGVLAKGDAVASKTSRKITDIERVRCMSKTSENSGSHKKLLNIPAGKGFCRSGGRLGLADVFVNAMAVYTSRVEYWRLAVTLVGALGYQARNIGEKR